MDYDGERKRKHKHDKEHKEHRKNEKKRKKVCVPFFNFNNKLL